jgi:hypothetical protein
MCGSVLNKANELLREPVLRNILGQSPNKLDIRSIIEHRDILIVNLAKSEIGTEYARLIGAFIVSQIALAAAARSTHPVKAALYAHRGSRGWPLRLV